MVKGVPDRSLLLPPHTRLLYIGPPKTGTTSLQKAAEKARPELLDHGVFYPGTEENHREAIFAFMRRAEIRRRSNPRGATKAEVKKIPPKSVWDDFMADVNSEATCRVLISHESISRASDEVARKFIEAVGPDQTHVVVTLRSPAAVLPARWSELLKEGLSDTLDEWLHRVYDPDTDRPLSVQMQRYLDQGGLVRRWADAVGSDNVTVIVVDKANKNLLTDTFEQLLGLPDKTLTGAASGGDVANRSLSMPEAELLRRTNARLDLQKIPWSLYEEILYWGVIPQLLGRRTPERDEPRVHLPPWAAELAQRDGETYAEQIADSKVRIVGDLADLYAQPQTAEDAEEDEHSHYAEIAVEALIGAIHGAVGSDHEAARQIGEARQRSQNDAKKLRAAVKKLSTAERQTVRDRVKKLPSGQRPQSAADSFTTKELLRGLSIRLKHKARTGKSKPLK